MTNAEFKGKILSVTSEAVSLPNGRTSHYDIVRHPGATGILPLFDNGDVLLLKQYRPAIKNYIWEIPAGTLEKSEEPLDCAKRELKEETGLTAKSWKELTVIHTSPGYCDERIYIFLAQDLTQGIEQREDYECIETHRLTLEKVKDMVLKKEITDGQTLSAIAAYWLSL